MPPTNPPQTELNFYGMRPAGGFVPATSIECYTFYPDYGAVELRHNSQPTLSDSGTYQGDATHGWQISWRSGRTSVMAVAGDGLLINGSKFSPIKSCVNF